MAPHPDTIATTSRQAPASRPPTGLRAMVVEDEAPLATLISSYLERDGFEVAIAGDGHDALDLARKFDPDVVVLDLGLPKLDGVEVCRALRTFSDAYVVMLTARAEEIDTVIGLSVGADDYQTKPFSPRELMARIQAMMRRPRTRTGTPTVLARPREVRTFGGLSIDIGACEVAVGDATVSLTRTEFNVLAALSRDPSIVLTRTQLIAAVWGPSWVGDEHLVDVHIGHLRRKLGDDATVGRYVRTVRGVGYRMGTGQMGTTP